MRPRRSSFLIPTKSLLCALVLLEVFARSTATAEEPNRRALGGELPSYEAPRDPSAAVEGSVAQPVGAVSLRDALGAALLGSPDLAKFSFERRAAEARALQARALPNPEVETEVEDFAGRGSRSGFRGSQTTLRLWQLVELGGKRGQRMLAASLESDLSAWDYEVARLAVLTDVTKAFLLVLSLQERAHLADESLGVAETAVRSVDASVRTGAVSPVEAARARVAKERAATERSRVGRELDAARAQLAASLGGHGARFERVDGDLEEIDSPPALEALLDELADNPDIARWGTEIARRRALLDLERARMTPDVTLSLGGRFYADDDSAGAVGSVSVPLPLFDRNRGNVLAAHQELNAASAEKRRSEVRARAELEAAYQALRSAYDTVRAIDERVLPQAQEAFDGAQRAYASGLFRYVEVLDAQRTLFEVKAEHIDALVAYHTARADAERLIGAPLPPTTPPARNP